MKLSGLFLCTTCMLAYINGYCQKVTISRSNVRLKVLFEDIRDQTGYDFVFKDEADPSLRKTVNVKNVSLDSALRACLYGTMLTYKLADSIITIRFIVSTLREDPRVPVPDIIRTNGTVLSDQMGMPLEAVTVKVQGTGYFNISNSRGVFIIKRPAKEAKLEFTCVGYERKIVMLTKHDTSLQVVMKQAVKSLDETMVMAYGVSSQRMLTGNTSKVRSTDIAAQPVSNPLEALAGRVAGVTLTAANGLPGANQNILVRGRGSLTQGTQPLYVVDGIPVLFDKGGIGQVAYLNNQNPFNTINPADIESIDVLKDAIATAIYGSMGANGVILINTKKGKPGKLQLAVNAYSGVASVGKTLRLLNREQYLGMRKEAFSNDGVLPTTSNAPDLTVWDTTRYTDWKKELIGGQAHITNIQASVSGGTLACQYFISGNFYRTGTVYPNSQPFNKTTIRSNINLISPDKKFKAYFSAFYGVDMKRFPGTGITQYIYLPPDAPAMHESNGKLKWTNGLENPYSYTLQNFSGQNSDLTGNTVLQYIPVDAITLKVNLGYEQLNNDEHLKVPIASLLPSPTTTGSVIYGTSRYKSWVIEPQALYHSRVGSGVLDILMGMSWQKRENTGLVVSGTEYKDDDMLGNISAAPKLTSTDYSSVYKYSAVFGRLTYNLSNKYLADLNIRRDGSSRFGPANRFSTFGAMGLGWVFTEEPWFYETKSVLSFGKIRANAGVTGNDQIGDYRYYDLWDVNNNVEYDSITGMVPRQLFNPKLKWERSIKREVGISLGFLKDKYWLSVSYYSNISNNQLLSYTIPAQTGFNNLLRNLDAEIHNKGLEVEAILNHMETKRLSWSTSLNFTIPRNKLVRYPGLEQSTDLYKYKVGEPLSVRFGYNYTGVNPATGVYTFQDINKDGNITSPVDIQVIGDRDKRFYGGVQNTIRFKNLECDLLLQFAKQTGYAWFASMQSEPGQMMNQPDIVLDRWQKQDDQAAIQAWSNATYTPQFKAFTNLQGSNASLVDASFMRLRNVMISYTFGLPGKLKTGKLKAYIQGQNLLTLTGYKGMDPEIQDMTILPSLKTFVGGIQVVF